MAEARSVIYKIPINSLRVLARTMNVFCKLNDSVYVELLTDGIRMDTVGDARSVYATVRLQQSFFQSIEVSNGPSQIPADGSLTNSRMLRLTTRLVLSVLRTLPLAAATQMKANLAMQRDAEANQLEVFALRHDARRCRIVFEAHFAHGLVRRHSLAYAESDRLSAVFNRSGVHQCMIRCGPRTLFDALGSFSSKQEDILACFDERDDRIVLLFKTYLDDSDERHSHVFSEAVVDEDQLDECRLKRTPVSRRTAEPDDDNNLDESEAELRYPELVFNLREFRAMLTLLEASGSTIRIPVTLLFETGGKPLIVEYAGSDEYQATFALATSALPAHRRAAHGRISINSHDASRAARPDAQRRKATETAVDVGGKRAAISAVQAAAATSDDADQKSAQVQIAQSNSSVRANADADADVDVDMNAYISQAIGPPPLPEVSELPDSADADADAHSGAQRRFLRELSKSSVSVSRNVTHDSVVYDSDENEQEDAQFEDATDEIGW